LPAQARALSAIEATEARQRLAANSVRIGRVVPGSSSGGGGRGGGGGGGAHNALFQYTEVWEDGPLLREIKLKQVRT
jgi:hypothetical protein